MEAAEKGIDLEGPSAGRSQSIEGYAKEDRPLDVADFKVKLNSDTKELIILSCPNNEIPLDQVRSEKTGQFLVHFDNKKCKECLLNNRCPVKIGARVSTLTVGEAQYAGTLWRSYKLRQFRSIKLRRLFTAQSIPIKKLFFFFQVVF